MKQLNTVFAWNSQRIIIRYAREGDEELVREGLQIDLEHEDDDPRWQIVEGVLIIDATNGDQERTADA